MSLAPLLQRMAGHAAARSIEMLIEDGWNVHKFVHIIETAYSENRIPTDAEILAASGRLDKKISHVFAQAPAGQAGAEPNDHGGEH